MRALGVLKARDPERRRKISETMRGKPKPPHVLEAMHEARRGSHHTKRTRQQMSVTHRRRGKLVPGTIPWTPNEDELVRTLAPDEAARKTGRSLLAVYKRRFRLGVTGGQSR
jgi:hypothetical protein